MKRYNFKVSGVILGTAVSLVLSNPVWLIFGLLAGAALDHATRSRIPGDSTF